MKLKQIKLYFYKNIKDEHFWKHLILNCPIVCGPPKDYTHTVSVLAITVQNIFQRLNKSYLTEDLKGDF